MTTPYRFRASTVAGRMVGNALRELRANAGLDPFEVRDRTGIVQSTLSRAECGINIPTLGHELGTLLGLYGADRPTRQRLTDIAARAQHLGWCATREAGHSADHWDPLVRAEKHAVSLQCWHPIAVPAVVQTPAYARWALAATGAEHVGSQVAARTSRQDALLASQNSSVHVSVLITRAALRIPDADVRIEQVAHLIRLAQQSFLTLRITEAFPGEIGNFEIITGRDRWVHIDHPTLDLAVEGEQQLRRHDALWHTLSEHAVSAEDTRDFLTHTPTGTVRAGHVGR